MEIREYVRYYNDGRLKYKYYIDDEYRYQGSYYETFSFNDDSTLTRGYYIDHVEVGLWEYRTREKGKIFKYYL